MFKFTIKTGLVLDGYYQEIMYTSLLHVTAQSCDPAIGTVSCDTTNGTAHLCDGPSMQDAITMSCLTAVVPYPYIPLCSPDSRLHCTPLLGSHPCSHDIAIPTVISLSLLCFLDLQICRLL